MKKFHVSEVGVRECTAQSSEKCPIGGVHYNILSEAIVSFEQSNSSITVPHALNRKDSIMQSKNIVVGPSWAAGSRYARCVVSTEMLSEYRNQLRDIVGERLVDEMEANKRKRDGSESYYITIVTPPEARKLTRLAPFPNKFSVTMLGIGSTFTPDGKKQAYYVVCDSPEITEWRRQCYLPSHDLHITLGFIGGDVHGASKDKNTLLGKRGA